MQIDNLNHYFLMLKFEGITDNLKKIDIHFLSIYCFEIVNSVFNLFKLYMHTYIDFDIVIFLRRIY